MQFVKPSTQMELTFSDGTSSLVDENVINYINELHKKESMLGHLPFFGDLNQSIDNYNDNFLDFYRFIISNHKLSKSQLFQDLFVFYNFENLKNGSYLEVGTVENGKYSNVSLLASHLGWQGFIVEGDVLLCDILKNNYPECKVLNKSLILATEKDVTTPFLKVNDFLDFKIDLGDDELNSQKEILDVTKKLESFPKQLSINEIFKDFFNSNPVEYLSLNLNDQNIKIIEDLDFKNFAPKIITVNDYFRKFDTKLDSLLAINGYLRFFKEHTQCEKWYVLQE